jgi:hypothetical protein
MNLFSFVDEIIKIIDKRKKSLSDNIINGSVQDIEHYRSMTGKINGFDESIHILKDFVKSLEKDNNSWS